MINLCYSSHEVGSKNYTDLTFLKVTNRKKKKVNKIAYHSYRRNSFKKKYKKHRVPIHNGLIERV